MIEQFKIYEKENKQIIEHLVYPKFIGVITFNNPISDIEDIKLFDNCNDVKILAKAMREAGDYLYNFKKMNYKNFNL